MRRRRRGRDGAIIALAALAGAAALPTLVGIHASLLGWAVAAALAALGVVAQQFLARVDRERSHHATALVVLTAGALLLPLGLLVLATLVLFVPRCLQARRAPWPARAFEGANEILAGTSASLSAYWAHELARPAMGDAQAWAIAALAAAIAFVAAIRVPRLLIVRLQGSDTLAWTAPILGLSMQLVLSALGATVAVSLLVNPWLAPLAAAPLFLVQRSFQIPWLEQQAHLDPKTGLFNASYFERAAEQELERGRVLHAPFSILVADLDHLREINNTHGHLAGDAVLKGVGAILRRDLRPSDIPSRFGGEEFAVILSATDHEEALAMGERLRAAVARTDFGHELTGLELRATVSIGVASYPQHGTTTRELVHLADLAVYRAKLQGRNRVFGTDADALVGRPGGVVTAPVSLVGEEATPSEKRPSPAPSPPRSVAGESLAPFAAAAATAFLAAAVMLRLPYEPFIAVAAAFVVAALALLFLRRRRAADAAAAAAATHRERAERLWRKADTLHSQNVSLERANRLLRERSAAAMETLSAAIDARDGYTAGHSRRVQRVAVAVGRELGLSDPELDVLGHAARFHDVGKLAVPEAILLKPEGLDSAEWDVVRRHPDEGARLIEHLGFLGDALPAIRHHHEHYDGSGYPDGLIADEIPLGARIIHLADALDAMLTPRVYRPALEPAEALSELQRRCGTQFCPNCVEALDRVMLAELEQGMDVPGELLAC